MKLKPWQISAIRRMLGVYSDRKSPPTDFVTFSHSIAVSPAEVRSPLELVAKLAKELSRQLGIKHEDLRLILTSSSREIWLGERKKLEDERNGNGERR